MAEDMAMIRRRARETMANIKRMLHQENLKGKQTKNRQITVLVMRSRITFLMRCQLQHEPNKS
jgi:hypothetical protein